MTDGPWTTRPASHEDAPAIASFINAHSRRFCGEDRVGLVEAKSWFKTLGVKQDDTMC